MYEDLARSSLEGPPSAILSDSKPWHEDLDQGLVEVFLRSVKIQVKSAEGSLQEDLEDAL